jgi:hypothetical protein
MTVSTQVTSFVKSTGANGTTQDVALNFTPKAIIVYSSNSTTTALANEYSWSHGFSDGTNHAAMAIHSDDGSNTSDSGRIHSNADVYIKLDEATPTTTVTCRGSVAFQTNNLRFTWTVNDAVATRITVIAYAGSDITGVKVNTVNINETVNSATEDYTGLGFTPNGDNNTALFLIGVNHTANSSSAPTGAAMAQFGVATRAYSPHPGGTNLKQVTMGQNVENAQADSDTWRHSAGDRCFAITDTVGAYDHHGYLTAWITDGFRMTWDDAPTSTTVKFSYMVINGGQWDCGTITTPTSALANQDYAVSLSSKTPKGLMLFSVGGTAHTTIVTFALYSIGATDGTNHACHSAIDEDAQATMDGYRHHSTDSTVYRGLTTNGAISDTATFDSFTTDNFRLDYGTKSAFAQLIHYVAVADQFTSTLYDIPISETSVSVSESLTRVPVRVKSISETAVSVSEALARVPVRVKAISDTSVSVSDSLARIPTYLKPISETSITTNDSIARWISVSYTLAEPSISINDTIAGALFYPRTINESAISTNDTIVRLLAATRTVAEPSTSVSDTIARIQSLIKQISESAISINDSVQGSILFTALLIESRIKWYYSLLTRKII